MQDASVLDVAAFADHDGVTVGAEHRPVPDARLSADGDTSDEHGTGGDEGSSGDIGAVRAEREQWRQAGTQVVRRLAADRLGWPITRHAVTAAQNAQPEWAQVAAHIPAAGYRLVGDNLLRLTLTGRLENRDAGVDPAQARARRNQQAVGQQLPQPGGVGVERSPLGAAHGRDEVIPWRMHEKDPLAHAPTLPLLWALRMPRCRPREDHRARRQSERSQSRRAPGAGEPLGGTSQNPCKGASLKRRQVHGDA